MSPEALFILAQNFFRISTSFIFKMTSVERIHEYHNLPEETNVKKKGKKLPEKWPREGAISFSKMSYAYFRDGPVILKNIDLEIRPSEKVSLQ